MLVLDANICTQLILIGFKIKNEQVFSLFEWWKIRVAKLKKYKKNTVFYLQH